MTILVSMLEGEGRRGGIRYDGNCRANWAAAGVEGGRIIAGEGEVTRRVIHF